MLMQHASPVPRHAATIMLLREDGNGLEVLMTRRHENMAFMGGLWVFPGGTLRPEDALPRTLARIADRADVPCLRLHTLYGTPLAAQDCLSLAVAACRETFEEAGVLLAVDHNGRSCSVETFARLQSDRTTVAARPAQFAVMLEREQLWLDVSQLIYWAHWITPSTAPQRFDTRFFAIDIGPDQAIAADTTETTECRWVNPAAVVDSALACDLPIAPPTLYTLVDLRDSYDRHGSLQSLLAAEAQRGVPPILPKRVEDGTVDTLIMPWDEGYATARGDSGPPALHYPPSLLRQPSRLTMPRRPSTN